MPADEPANELLLRELGRINSELASQRRLNAMTVHDLSNPAQVILGLSEVLLEHQVLDPMVRKHLEQLHRSALTMTALITDLNQGFSLDDQRQPRARAARPRRAGRPRWWSAPAVLADAKDMRLTVSSDPSRPAAAGSTATRPARASAGQPARQRDQVLARRGPRSPSRSTGAPTSPRSPSATRGRASARRARRASSRSSTARRPTSHLPGLGLGLFITKQIAESHGGTISVESEHGDGATFLLQVPLAVDVLADLA